MAKERGQEVLGGKPNQAPSKTTKGCFFQRANGRHVRTGQFRFFSGRGWLQRAQLAIRAAVFAQCLLKTRKTQRTRKTQISGVPRKSPNPVKLQTRYFGQNLAGGNGPIFALAQPDYCMLYRTNQLKRTGLSHLNTLTPYLLENRPRVVLLAA